MHQMNTVVDHYIDKQKSPQKEICQKLRETIFRLFPGILEEMKWGVPAYGGGKYYIVALKDHVNLGFSIRGLSKEEQKFFEGSGKTMMHIRIFSLLDIDEERIFKLMKLEKRFPCYNALRKMRADEGDDIVDSFRDQ